MNEKRYETDYAAACEATHALATEPLRPGVTCSGGWEAHNAHLDANGECPWEHDEAETEPNYGAMLNALRGTN